MEETAKNLQTRLDDVLTVQETFVIEREQTLQQLRELLEQANERVAALQTELNRANEGNTGLRRQIEELEHRNALSIEETQRVQQRVRDLETELEQSAVTNAELEAGIQQKNEALDSVRRDQSLQRRNLGMLAFVGALGIVLSGSGRRVVARLIGGTIAVLRSRLSS